MDGAQRVEHFPTYFGVFVQCHFLGVELSRWRDLAVLAVLEHARRAGLVCLEGKVTAQPQCVEVYASHSGRMPERCCLRAVVFAGAK